MSKISRRFPFAHAFSQLLRVILPVAGLMISHRVASAQGAGIMEGSRVQITTPGAKKVTGIVKSVTTDSTTIFVDGNGGVRRFLNSDMTELRVSSGRTTIDGVKKGAMWGGGFGAALAIVVLATPEPNNNYEYAVASNNAIAANVFIGGLLWGMGIGAFTKAEHWDSVPVHTRLAASSRGVGLSFAFSPSFLH